MFIQTRVQTEVVSAEARLILDIMRKPNKGLITWDWASPAKRASSAKRDDFELQLHGPG